MKTIDDTVSVLAMLESSEVPFWSGEHMGQAFPENRGRARELASNILLNTGLHPGRIHEHVLAAVIQDAEDQGVRLRMRASKNADMIIRKGQYRRYKGSYPVLDRVVPTRLMTDDELRTVQNAFHQHGVPVIVTADQSLRITTSRSRSRDAVRAEELHLAENRFDHLSSAIRTVEYLLERDVALSVASNSHVARSLSQRCSSAHVQKAFDVGAAALRALPADADDSTIEQVFGVIEASLIVLERRGADRGKQILTAAVHATIDGINHVYNEDEL